MKNTYETPTVEIVEMEDIITTSTTECQSDYETDIL